MSTTLDKEIKEIKEEGLSGRVIAAAIEVHRELGPGLLESAYAECLAREFVLRSITFQKEVAIPVRYKGVALESAYRLDFVVDGLLAVEIKSVESLKPIHAAQLITYLKLGRYPSGLLMNFNVAALKTGIRKLFSGSKRSSP